MKRLLVCAVLLGLVAQFGMSSAQARPFRGSAKWSWLLCKTHDAGTPTHDAAYYKRMLLQSGTGGLADYWHDVSYANLNMDGSVVMGWYTMAQTKPQMDGLDRWGRVDACKQAAASAGYTPPAGNQVGIITFPDVDMFGWSGGAFLPPEIDVGGAAHESGHGVGFNHSFSNDPNYRNADWAQIGEYDDPWDVMSWGNDFRVATPFGDGPSGLTAFHLDRMGWLPRSRIITFGADGVRSRTVTLAALNRPDAAGALSVRIPFDPNDLQRHYTVEFRSKHGWDNGIPADTVLVTEIRRHDDGQYYAHLVYQLAPTKTPAQSLNANGVTVSVVSVDRAAHQAKIAITSAMVDRCVQGYVWREANSTDHTCVVPSTRAETRNENTLAASRRQSGGGPYGPDTCKQGFVWRDTGPSDHVCVTPASRSRANQDNAAAAARRNPARLAFGPNGCKPGFVWREADDFDWVCVSPTTRAQTKSENGLATSRRSPAGGAYGADTCKQGFVWRDAFPGDHVCVPPASRSQAVADNGQAESRLLTP